MQRLTALFRVLRNRGIEVVVLDCHGGLDNISLAARTLADRTIVVTEADLVTFHGSMELLDFYERQTDLIRDQNLTPHRADTPKPIDIIVNRIPPKFAWRDLDNVYRRVLHRFRSGSNLNSNVLVYIPTDDAAVDDFGSYPFAVVVAPRSLFAKKIALVAYLILEQRPELRHYYFKIAKFDRLRPRLKAARQIVSYEEQNRRRVLAAVAWYTCCWSAWVTVVGTLFVTTFSAEFDNIVTGAELAPMGGLVRLALEETASSLQEQLLVWYGTALAIFVSALVALRALWSLTRLHATKYHVLRSLWRVAPSYRTTATRIQLARLALIAAGGALGMFFLTVVVAVLCAIAYGLSQIEVSVPI